GPRGRGRRARRADGGRGPRRGRSPPRPPALARPRPRGRPPQAEAEDDGLPRPPRLLVRPRPRGGRRAGARRGGGRRLAGVEAQTCGGIRAPACPPALLLACAHPRPRPPRSLGAPARPLMPDRLRLAPADWLLGALAVLGAVLLVWRGPAEHPLSAASFALTPDGAVAAATRFVEASGYAVEEAEPVVFLASHPPLLDSLQADL